ncbi:MAG TPA: DUF1269 domain-containing protein [Terriglobales bacterium]|nr:DUF1269 domain-containing protein [Terriglobales bacterium]
MSDLIVVTYEDQYKAAEVLAALQRLQKKLLIDLEDAAYVMKDEDGKFKLHETVPLTRIGAASGMWSGTFWGMLIGLLFMQPGLGAITGAAIGAATGAARGKASDYGIPNDFIVHLAKDLEKGSSALFVLVRRSTPDKVLAEVSQYGGTVLHSTLPNDVEARLQSALAA